MVELWQRKQRAVEEEQLCVGDMCNAYAFYMNKHIALQQAVQDNTDIGRRAVLFRIGADTERHCSELLTLFHGILPNLTPVTRVFAVDIQQTYDDNDAADVSDLFDADIDFAQQSDVEEDVQI